MPENDKPLLEMKNVDVQFGDTWALHDVSLSLHPGETRIVFGAAGSGKTTLLKAIVGLVGVDSGDIKLFDEDVTSLKEHDLFALRSRAGFLFQEGGLFDSISVGQNVEYPLLNQQAHDGASTRGMPEEEAKKRALEALTFVELAQTFDKAPGELSGGMRRRVGIARAVVTEPPLVLYDSPTAGLDPITANTIMALIAKERDVRNSASIIVSHRFQDGELMDSFRYDAEHEELVPVGEDDPARTRTKFIVMKEGEIVFFGTRQELSSSNDNYLKRFIRHEG